MNFVTAELVREDGPAVIFAGHRLPVLTITKFPSQGPAAIR